MTSRFAKAFAAAVVSIASLAPALHAQNLSARVQIPFAFDCGPSHFSPGLYTIDRNSPQLLQLQGRSSSALVMFRTDVNSIPSKTSYALFRKYGDRYFLQEIWTASSREHISVYESSAEQKAMQQEKAGNDKPATLQLAFVDQLAK